MHKDRYFGGVALVILGGPSGANWMKLRDVIRPDVIITSNGNTDTPGAEYWLLTENMNYQNGRALQGDERAIQFMRMLNAANTARFRMVSHRSWNLLKNKMDAVKVRRRGREIYDLDDFSFRQYGDGYWWGWMMKNTHALKRSVQTHVGTVALQMIHHAGILGCAEVHTIGFDLMFKDNIHHWYSHPRYQPDRFSTEHMFIARRYGETVVHTRLDMLETTEYLKAFTRQGIFERDSFAWIDHSDGLLKLEGLECAQ